eukprot:TRINITY_DN2074_c0_g1_i4.p2 TRINITY_DN2074_c0_g1~~TRINITY_DN2074_c0_g1_i4.p2  ORF type:complete len:224 (+),score=52.40 TRINITY_DN2074_c0_g1_i4:551-1222(+)
MNENELGDILSTIGLEIKAMARDGNCLFHTIADQIYGDPDMHDAVRRLCINYMEKERDHYSQFVTEDFNSYLNRKRLDRSYGNHLELQAISEMYSRPLEIYIDSAEPINMFQNREQTDIPPLRLSYHNGNHYNSVRDPNNSNIGIGIGIPGKDDAERDIMERACNESEQNLIEEGIIEQTTKESENLLANEAAAVWQLQMESELDYTDSMIEQAILYQSLTDY